MLLLVTKTFQIFLKVTPHKTILSTFGLHFITMSSVDAMLYRPLKSGNQYNGLIPPYQGQEHNFDKESDNSTTYDTLKYMAEWSNKYAYQMKRIAPLLKGRTIQETANNIYQFLYSHFQYKLDGSLQNLYSPSAAWHFRKTGFDCKTYSLLASCILQNLNITHSFRMVQQAGIMPGEWSHVYVIVPANNTEYVIDATTHTNKQVSFTKKHDYVMKHLGLASPAVYGLGCSCQGKPITRKGLGAPGNLENTVSNFHLFLNELEKKGVPKANTDKMLELVRYNVENGIDPNMHEIVQKAFLPAGQLAAPTFGSYSPAPAMTFGSTPSYSLTSNSVLTKPSVLTSGGASSGSTFGNYSGAVLSNLNVGGINAGSAVSAVTGLIAGNPLGIIGLISSLIPVDKTFGAVFANGFNLSCWGSTAPPSVTKAWGEKDYALALNETLGKGLNQQNLNAYLDAMNYLEDRARNWAGKMKSCSKTGLNNYADAAKKIKEGVIEGVKAALAKENIQVIALPLSQRSTTPINIKFSHAGFNGEYDYKVERFNIIMPTATPPKPSVVTYQTVQNLDGTTTQVPVVRDAQVKSSSSSTGLILGGALLALKLLI